MAKRSTHAISATMRAFLLAGFLAAAQFPAPAQEAGAAPARTGEFAAAIAEAEWQELESGLWLLQAQSGAARLVAFRVSDRRFAFAVAAQEDPQGEFVDALGSRAGAVIAVNGGFFGQAENGGKLFPVGLLRLASHNHGQEWKNIGGYLAMGADRVDILPTRSGQPDTPFVIQSKPLLIEPGGTWAMNTNDGLSRPRTLVCRRSGETLILVAHGIGLSLFEAGWLLRESSAGGAFGCDAALALDGGGSTQLWVDSRADLSIRGETRVHNALIVLRK